MITDYNSTKFGIDIFDEMASRYSYMPPVRRWPLRLFMFLVDSASINSYVVFNGNLSRRNFIDNLSSQLMAEQKQVRAASNNYFARTFLKISNLYDGYVFLKNVHIYGNNKGRWASYPEKKIKY